MMLFPLVGLLMVISCAPCGRAEASDNPPVGVVAAAPKIEGTWLGLITAGVQNVRLGLVVKSTPEGGHTATLWSLDPQRTERAIESIRLEGSELRFSMSKPSVVYTGRIEGDPPTINGVWSQRGVDYPVRFGRVAALPGPTRPQEPARPLPYREELVKFDTGRGGITLGGTLTTPNGPGKHPAFLLISGSGPQDRDETTSGHRPFLVLADALTRRGFAVLRLDDRGVAQSTGDVFGATLGDLAGDALAGVEWLRGREGIDPAGVGLIGHSEGGLVAAIAASRSANVARIAMLGTPGLPLRELRLLQTESLGRSLGASEEAIAGIRTFNTEVFAALDAGETGEPLRATLKAAAERFVAGLPEDQRGSYRALASELERGGMGMATPWMRSLLAHDPVATLALVRCPVLAIIGEKDVQVPAEANIAALRAALVAHPQVRGTVVSIDRKSVV